MKRKKIEAVVICVNYSDFLAYTLPHNKTFFDRMVVVTDMEDSRTKKLCEFHNVECIQTNIFYNNGDTLNKGQGINVGLANLDRDEWVVHLDADIWLPPLTREILENVDLDPTCIYGIDRMMCPNFEEWIDYVSDPKPIHESWIYIHPNIFPMGVRIAEYKSKGYEPIGYFQMWNPGFSGVHDYPKEHGKVDRSDVLHAKQFPRIKRQLLPEIICVHLDSNNNSEMGANWNGRKTPYFGLLKDNKPIPVPKNNIFARFFRWLNPNKRYSPF